MNLSSFFQLFLLSALTFAPINLVAMINNTQNIENQIIEQYKVLASNRPSMNRSNAASYNELATYIDSCTLLAHNARSTGNQKIAFLCDKMAGQANNFVERLINN